MEQTIDSAKHDSAEGLFKKYLDQRGMRFTRERKLILDEVMARHEHFEPEDIVISLRTKGERVSTASVYRTLPLLIESGIMTKHDEGMGCRLEHVLGHEHHDHMVCIGCGRVIEFVNEGIEQLQSKVANDHGFLVKGHRLLITGLCEECRGH